MTFQEPPLYQFERHDKYGRVLGDKEAGENEETTTKGTVNTNGSDGDSSIGEIEGPPPTQPLEAETKGQTQEKMKSPIEELTDQAKTRKRRALERKTRDSNDAKHGVTFKLLLDPRLQVPPHDEGAIKAVKIAAPRNVYIAALIYRVPAHRRNDQTRTMIYSHGNATDLGATFPMQVVLAHSLDINVVVYDYSGYGESGGVPTEASTYRDIDAVYDYVVDTLAHGNSKNVILYGQSVGSGPCCYLAAKKDIALGGLILHSPFTSGMRVLTPSR
jgi:acetyl esterase/lipase